MNDNENFAGTKILLMAFLANFVGTGIGFYGFSVFFKPLAEYLGCGREGIGTVNGVSLVVGAICAPFVGRMADRLGPKPLLLGGSFVASILLALMSRIQSYNQMLLIYGFLFPIAHLGLGDIVTSSTVARYFPYKTGRALGLATVGVSFGGVIMPPLTQTVINRSGGSWRPGFLALSAIEIIVVFIPALILLRGLKRPAFDPNEIVDEDEPALSRSEAMKSLAFWKMVALFSLSYLPLGTMLVQQVPFLIDMGVTPTKAAWTLSLTATMGMIGKLTWGYIFDRGEGRYAISAAITLQMLSILWLLQANTLWEAMIFGAGFGFGMGGLVPMNAAMRSRQFGAKHLGAIMGVSTPFIMLAQATGQPFSGRVFDKTGSYKYAFIMFIACHLISIAVALTLKDPSKNNKSKKNASK